MQRIIGTCWLVACGSWTYVLLSLMGTGWTPWAV